MSTLDHILRSSLPWRREAPQTECGRPGDDVASALTFEEAQVKFRSLGKERAIMTSCVTCFQTAQYRGRDTWAQSPTAVVAREAERHRYPRPGEEPLLDRELRAIAALVDAHRDEFDGYVDGLAETTSLEQQRRKRRTRGASA